MLENISAKVDGEPCCAYMGPDGAGHFVKMVHNGIEYADMQFIAEAYDLLRGAGLETGHIADVFAEWNSGDLDSFLIETTAEVLRQVDAVTGKPLVDVIVDQAEQKGTGRWTVQVALELGVPVNAIAESVFARSTSGHTDLRSAAAGTLTGPDDRSVEDVDQLVDDVRAALWSSKVVAYAQGLDMIREASRTYDWGIDVAEVAKIWRGGCIIRARLLERIRQAYSGTSLTTPAGGPRRRRGAGPGPGQLAARGGRGRDARRTGARLRRRAVLLRHGAQRAAARRRWCRGCATSSGRTPTCGSTARAPSTRCGRGTGPRPAPEPRPTPVSAAAGGRRGRGRARSQRRARRAASASSIASASSGVGAVPPSRAGTNFSSSPVTVG